MDDAPRRNVRSLLDELNDHDTLFSSYLCKRNQGRNPLEYPTRLCLDRDWRKAVFHVLGYAAKQLCLPITYEEEEEIRFKSKIFPV